MFSPINLVLQCTFFAQLFQSLSVSDIALLHFFEQFGLEKVKIFVYEIFDFQEA